jgi:hypothetical protein
MNSPSLMRHAAKQWLLKWVIRTLVTVTVTVLLIYAAAAVEYITSRPQHGSVSPTVFPGC